MSLPTRVLYRIYRLRVTQPFWKPSISNLVFINITCFNMLSIMFCGPQLGILTCIGDRRVWRIL